MADRFAILPASTTSLWSATSTWSASSGGATGASVPTSADNVIVDAASVAGAAAILSVDATAYCLSMTWTGATNTPTFAGSSGLSIYGSLTFIAAMTKTYDGNITFKATTTGWIVTVGGTLECHITFNGAGGGWTLQDALNNGAKDLVLTQTTLNTNGQTISCGNFYLGYGIAGVTVTLGASIINCTKCIVESLANLTLNANTSSIRVSGTGSFWGNGHTFYEVQLNGTSHTVSGANIFTTLTSNVTGTNTFAAGMTITGTLTHTAGTINFAGYNFTIGVFDSNNANTRTITLGSGTFTINGTGAVTKWDITDPTNLTFTANTATIILTNSGVNAQTFGGGGKTYYNLTIQGAGDYALTISGSNTFNVLTIDRSVAAKTLKITNAMTQTVASFVCAVSGTTVLTITNTSATTAGILAKSGGGKVQLDYLNLSYNTGSPASTWYYGNNSTVGAGVTGWAAEAAVPVSPANLITIIRRNR